MAITEQAPYNNATGNGSTTVFAYTFKLFAASDLKVYLDGVLKTITTDYTISGVGDESGGSVTFLTAPAASVDVMLVRSIPYDRLVDYQTSGDLLADTLDDDLDRMEAQLQQLAAYGGVLLQSDLPLAPYNANGRRIINVAQPTEASDAVNKAYLDAAIAGYPENTSFIISNVAIIANTTYTEPVVVLPGGMFTISSGVTLTINAPFQAGLYQVFAGDGSVVFGSGTITEVYPEWWGADPSGDVDSAPAINKAVASVGSKGAVKFGVGIYQTSDTIKITDTCNNPKTIRLIGSGKKATYLYHTGVQTTGAVRIEGEAAAFSGGYISQNSGDSSLEHIAVGSVAGPAINLWFTNKNILTDILLFSGAEDQAMLKIEGCIECRYYNISDTGNDVLPSGVESALNAIAPITKALFGWSIQNGDYTGLGGYGYCLEHFFFGCRTDAIPYKEASVRIVKNDTTAPQVGNISFVGCKLTGPTNYGADDAPGADDTDYPVVLIDGATYVYFINTFLEPVNPGGVAKPAIRINNDLGDASVWLSQCQDISAACIDFGPIGGTPGPYKINFNMAGSKFYALRDNYGGDGIGTVVLTNNTFYAQPQIPGYTLFDYYVAQGNIVNGSGDPVNMVPQQALSAAGEYKTGAWTPGKYNLTGGATPVLSGTYTRIGNLVHVRLLIDPNSTGSIISSVGSTYFDGLPYAPDYEASGGVSDSNATSFGEAHLFVAGGKIYTPNFNTAGWVTVSLTYFTSDSI